MVKNFEGHVISAVGWNLEAPDEYDTGFIVAGTTKGFFLIFIFFFALNSCTDFEFFHFLIK